MEAPPLRRRAERALDALAFFVSDARYGLGAFLGVYLLTEHSWTPAEIGAAVSLGALAGLAAQGPLGALVDAVRAKRLLIAGAVVIVTATSVVIPFAPQFWSVSAAGLVGAVAGVVIGPALGALSLGVVGPDAFARRHCRNEALFHAGDGALCVLILLTAPIFGSPVLFISMIFTAVATCVAASSVPKAAVDHRVARGFLPEARGVRAADWRVLLTNRALLAFALCGALFHLANASMLGLAGQRMAADNPEMGLALTAASAIVAQSVMVPVALVAGARADRWGRKPFLLAAFGALALRGVLLAQAEGDPLWTLAIQLLDGFAAGMIGALAAVVIADGARGTGHFAAAQGAVGTAHGLGAALSQFLGGALASGAGYATAFLALSGVAVLGGLLFAWLMPETKPARAEAQPEVAFRA